MAMSVPDEGNCGCNHLSTNGPVKVEVTTLDAYVRQMQLARVDFIKIDVEGAEVSLLKGAEETINRYHPTLIIEINASTLRRFGKTPADLIGTREKHSYRRSCAKRIGGLNPLTRVPVFGEEPNVFAFPTLICRVHRPALCPKLRLYWGSFIVGACNVFFAFFGKPGIYP